MRTRIATETLYQFGELSKLAQEKVLRTLNVGGDYWHNFLTTTISHFGAISGLGCHYAGSFDTTQEGFISIDNLSCYLSDIIAHYDEAIAEYPEVTKAVIYPFLAFFTAEEKQRLLRLEKYGILRLLTGQTSSENASIWCDVTFGNRPDRRPPELIKNLETAWSQLLENLEAYCLESLRKECPYYDSVEATIRAIKAGDYEFLKDGTLA